MTTRRKLKDIAITPAPGQVGVSFIFEEESPAEHFLLTTAIAKQLAEKLELACVLAANTGKVARPPGDGMGLSDFSALTFSTPKKEH